MRSDKYTSYSTFRQTFLMPVTMHELCAAPAGDRCGRQLLIEQLPYRLRCATVDCLCRRCEDGFDLIWLKC